MKLIDNKRKIIYNQLSEINKVDAYTTKIQIDENSSFCIKKDWKNINSIRLEGFIHMLHYFGIIDTNTRNILLENNDVASSITSQDNKGLNVQEQDNAGRHGSFETLSSITTTSINDTSFEDNKTESTNDSDYIIESIIDNNSNYSYYYTTSDEEDDEIKEKLEQNIEYNYERMIQEHQNTITNSVHFIEHNYKK